MEYTQILPGNDDSAALARPDFGMLRAWIAARQQALPTVRALAGAAAPSSANVEDPVAANLAILSGQTADSVPAGRFSHSYGCGATCPSQGENDA